MVRALCLGLLLLAVLFSASPVLAATQISPPMGSEAAAGKGAAPSPPGDNQRAAQQGRREGPHNPYDMDALKNFDAGSHRLE